MAPDRVALTASGLVTVTARSPVAADEFTFSDTFTWLLSTHVTVPRVMPVPETATFAHRSKFAPVMVIVVVRLRGTLYGVTPEIDGGGVTRKHPTHVPLVPVERVTTTSRSPVVAVAATDTFALSDVLFSTVDDLTVTPVPEKASVVPASKPVPVTLIVRQDAVWSSELGNSAETVGPTAATVGASVVAGAAVVVVGAIVVVVGAIVVVVVGAIVVVVVVGAAVVVVVVGGAVAVGS